VLLVVLLADSDSFLNQERRWPFAMLAVVLAYPVLDVALGFTPLPQWKFYWRNQTLFSFAAALTFAGMVYGLTRQRTWAKSKHWARILAVLIAARAAVHAGQAGRAALSATEQQRNFYGVVRVMENQFQDGDRNLTALQLMHGHVNHGIQFREEPWRQQAVSYYATNSGIELTFRLHPRRAAAAQLNIGVMGLGVGTLAAFAQGGDRLRFYEINPAVIELCRGKQPRFSYLSDCRGQAEIVAGDARLAMGLELAAGKPGQFDILVMDAFAGGTIPVHLLTAEAFQIYQRHLRDDQSVIAVNISNHYLDLSGVMTAVGRRFGWETLIVSSRGAPPDRTPSRWCLLTPNHDWLRQETFFRHAETHVRADEILWTDDFSNLFRVLR
jgi:hypothetical protein